MVCFAVDGPNFAVTHDVFQACELIREELPLTNFRLHALQWRGDFCATARHRK
jgi:hypothetical protein